MWWRHWTRSMEIQHLLTEHTQIVFQILLPANQSSNAGKRDVSGVNMSDRKWTAPAIPEKQRETPMIRLGANVWWNSWGFIQEHYWFTICEAPTSWQTRTLCNELSRQASQDTDSLTISPNALCLVSVYKHPSLRICSLPCAATVSQCWLSLTINNQ